MGSFSSDGRARRLRVGQVPAGGQNQDEPIQNDLCVDPHLRLHRRGGSRAVRPNRAFVCSRHLLHISERQATPASQSHTLPLFHRQRMVQHSHSIVRPSWVRSSCIDWASADDGIKHNLQKATPGSLWSDQFSSLVSPHCYRETQIVKVCHFGSG